MAIKSRPQSRGCRGTSQSQRAIDSWRHRTEPVTIRPSHVRKRRGCVEVSDENAEPSHPNVIEENRIKEGSAVKPETVAANERRIKTSTKSLHPGKATTMNCCTPKHKTVAPSDEKTNERRRLGFGVTPHRAFPSPSCFPQEDPSATRWVRPSGLASSTEEFASASPLSRFSGGRSQTPKRTSPSKSRRASDRLHTTPGITPRQAAARTGTPRNLLATPINDLPSSPSWCPALGEIGVASNVQQRPAPPLPFFGSRDRSCSPTTSLYPPSARARSPVGMSHGARALATLLNERSQIKR